MPANYSSKRVRDAQAFARWDALPEASFATMRVTRDQIKRLQARLVGTVVMKGDASYEADRHIFNPIFNRYPDFIVYCKTESDVAVAVGLAILSQSDFCLRSGGHSTAGYSTCDGILIDVSGLDDVSIDTEAMIASVGCGCTFGKLYAALDTYGLNVPAGECPDVRVGGFVQGGGYGFTSVTHGMNCDNVVSFRVLLASGDIVQADATTNADLFWALRGGTGGNFGVVLNVRYTLRPIGQVMGFALCWAMTSPVGIEQATKAMMVLQQSYMLNSICGPEMNLQVSLCFQNYIDPTQPPPPPDTPLQPYFMVRGMWLGDPTKLDSLLQPLRSLPGCIFQWIKTDSFENMNGELLNYPQGMPVLDQMPFEDKSSFYIARDLAASDWQALFALFTTAPNNRAYGYGEFYGGAINQVPRLATAFVHRSAALNLVMDTYWLLDSERETCETFLRNWNTLAAPLSNGESYQNYPSPSDPDFASRFWAEAYPALQVIKTKYDPANVFRFPQQVEPMIVPVELLDPLMPPEVVAALGEGIKVLAPARFG